VRCHSTKILNSHACNRARQSDLVIRQERLELLLICSQANITSLRSSRNWPRSASMSERAIPLKRCATIISCKAMSLHSLQARHQAAKTSTSASCIWRVKVSLSRMRDDL